MLARIATLAAIATLTVRAGAAASTVGVALWLGQQPNVSPLDAAQVVDGRFLAVGSMVAATPLGWIAELSGAGTAIRERTFSGIGAVSFTEVMPLGAGGALVSGADDGSFVVLRLDAALDPAGARRYTLDGQRNLRITAELANGDLLAVGEVSGSNGRDAVVLLLDATGSPRWAFAIDSGDDEWATRGRATPDGGALLLLARAAGDALLVKLDAAGAPEWASSYGPGAGDVVPIARGYLLGLKRPLEPWVRVRLDGQGAVVAAESVAGLFNAPRLAPLPGGGAAAVMDDGTDALRLHGVDGEGRGDWARSNRYGLLEIGYIASFRATPDGGLLTAQAGQDMGFYTFQIGKVDARGGIGLCAGPELESVTPMARTRAAESVALRALVLTSAVATLVPSVPGPHTFVTTCPYTADCPAPEAIAEVKAVRQGGSVAMTWRSDRAAMSYNVWYVALPSDIDRARIGSPVAEPVPGCSGTASDCLDAGAVAAPPVLRCYQVRGSCNGVSEGP